MTKRGDFCIDYGLYWPLKNRVAARLFTKESDFIVQERFGRANVSLYPRTSPGTLNPKEGSYLHFTLLKRNMSTFDAVNRLSRYFGVGEREIGYCGLKDTFAITAQRVSIPVKARKPVKSRHRFSGFSIFDGVVRDYPLSTNMHSGNHFTIAAYLGRTGVDSIERLKRMVSLLKRNEVPNYYGPQRFGPGKNGHMIGEAMVRGDFASAAKRWLATGSEAHHKGIRKNWGRWNKCIDSLGTRMLISQEARFIDAIRGGKDFPEAFMSIPLGSFFIRAYRSYLFNAGLTALLHGDRKIHKGARMELVGGDTKLTSISAEVYPKILKHAGISLHDFAFERMPELKQKGKQRAVLYEPMGLSVRANKRGKITLSFSLIGGAYASVLLGMLFDYKYPKVPAPRY